VADVSLRFVADTDEIWGALFETVTVAAFDV
jgi:hypothetical protein